MKICFVTSELAPFAKVGGLADVSSALPSALSRNGHQLKLVLPFYRDLKIDHAQAEPIPELADIVIQAGGQSVTIHGYRCPFQQTQDPAEDIQLILVKCDALYERDGIYGDAHDEFLRFLILSRASFEFCQRLQWAPDIIHCNDWQTGMIPLFIRTLYAWDQLFSKTRTVLTIHNIGHQGIFPSSILPFLNLSGGEHLLHQDDLKEGRINFLKTGLLFADCLTTVSPTYAREIQSPDYGCGLDQVLRLRQGDLHGILNGIDGDEWDPKTDELIPHNYSLDNLKPKLENKRALLELMQLDVDLSAPTFGIVSRLASQKGFDLMYSVIPDLLDQHDFRLVVLGSGQVEYANFFEALVARYPGRVGFYNGFSNEMAHLVEAGSDIFLMPSQYEPCGLNQMYSQAYGTAPLVRKTGGLADTVQHFNPNTGEGTGFVFDHYTSVGLKWAMEVALRLFNDPQQWHQLVVNAMKQDFSWQSKAQQYEEIYNQVLERPRY